MIECNEKKKKNSKYANQLVKDLSKKLKHE